MTKLFLALVLAVPFLTATPARTPETISFPGGSLLLLDRGQFVWESQDASGILPANVRRAVTVELESVQNGPPNIRALLSVETNDGRYELIPLSPEAMSALATALRHAGIAPTQ